MRTASTTFKPSLEQLEDRLQPSFLLGGNAVQQMAEPLNNIVSDMKSVTTQLTSNLNQGNQAALAHDPQTAGHFYGTAVGNYEQLLTDLHAIQAVSAADQAFIHAAAMTEFGRGDPTDLAVLYFGKFIGLDPLKSLQDPVDQANAIIQGQDVQKDITFMTNHNLGGIPMIPNDVTQPTF